MCFFCWSVVYRICVNEVSGAGLSSEVCLPIFIWANFEDGLRSWNMVISFSHFQNWNFANACVFAAVHVCIVVFNWSHTSLSIAIFHYPSFHHPMGLPVWQYLGNVSANIGVAWFEFDKLKLFFKMFSTLFEWMPILFKNVSRTDQEDTIVCYHVVIIFYLRGAKHSKKKQEYKQDDETP